MAKNSILLEYVIKQAKDWAANADKPLSVNYFVAAVLSLLSSSDEGNFPDELKNSEVERELDLVSKLFGKYDFKRDCAGDILTYIESDEYNSSADSIAYSKVAYSASSKAKQADSDTVTAAHYVECILASPSPVIKKYITEVNGPTEPKKEEEKPASSEFSDLFEALSKKTADVRTEEKEGEKPSESHEEKPEDNASGPEKLLGTVEKTREIQNKLLDNVFGQDQAVNAFVSGYFQGELMSFVRKDASKPKATFLFAGPPGVGKTFLAEQAAEALALPYKRFDMSEYSDKEANIEFCGSDKVYKSAKAGNVTSFVAENPKCVLLFDEIEKAHINVIYLFLQILDAGRIRDNYTDEEVSFSQSVIIFTTNVGKNLYNDSSIVNLSATPRKKVLKALSTDTDSNGNPLFPAAICSRFASGNVVMFNHLGARNLYTIAKRELSKNTKGFEATTGIKITADDKVATALMLSEGGKADARTVKGRSNALFHEELYELFRLLASDKIGCGVDKLKEIKINVSLDDTSEDIAKMFVNSSKPEILVFADEKIADACKAASAGIVCHTASDIAEAKEILFNNDISVIICDINCGKKDSTRVRLNAEDVSSKGHDFLGYALSKYDIPVYLIQENAGEISREEFLSFAKMGVSDMLTLDDTFSAEVAEKCDIAYQQGNMHKLARENKVLSYQTAQTLSEDFTVAEIELFDFHLNLATDVEDSKSVLDNVAKPDVKFENVIGAEDAKRELAYFVEYLKNPVKYMRRGVRAPKGILLYGPPGTGKTMLARAMAGESDVTFLTAEGNQFLKRYVGEGAQAVHDLFAAARKYAPSVLFIDEIDAIGKDRNSLSNDTTSDVLTAFLTEMDGFTTDTSKPVFVLAATNYDVEPGSGKTLDAALLRRFDRRIYVDLPNKDGRRRFIEMKMAKHPNVNLSKEQIENIAVRSTGMSLAELDSIFEMALRNAIQTEDGTVGDDAFEEAFETFNSGEVKQWSPDTLMRTARHESGHALMCWLGGEKPSYLTIVARGNHGGYMQHADNEGKALYTKAELLNRIATSLAGRAAEIVYYGNEDGISTGASSDLHSATATAEHMLCTYGMDDSVGMSYVSDAEKGSPSYAPIRARVNEILSEQLQRAVGVIEANRAAIDKMVEALMERNHLKENEIDEIFSATAINTLN